MSPLHCACKEGHKNVVKYLVENANCGISEFSSYNLQTWVTYVITILHVCILYFIQYINQLLTGIQYKIINKVCF